MFPECLVIYSAFHDYFSCLVPDLTLREYMTGDTCGAGGAHSSGTPGLTLDNSRVHVFPHYFFCVCVCRSTLSMSPVCPFWLLHWYLFLDIFKQWSTIFLLLLHGTSIIYIFKKKYQWSNQNGQTGDIDKVDRHT